MNKKITKEIIFVGDKSTNTFCEMKDMNEDMFIKDFSSFKSPKEAILSGFIPCKTHDPLNINKASKEIQKSFELFNNAPDKKIKEYDLVKNDINPERVRNWFQKKYDLTFQDYMRIIRINEQFKPSNIFEEFNVKDKNSIVINRIKNSLGIWLVGATKNGICLLQAMEKRMLETQLSRLKKYFKTNLELGTSPYFIQLHNEFNEYLRGERVKFDVPLDIKATPFQESVWQTLQNIPYGKTISYKNEAELLGNPNAIRAVAKANGDNRIAIIIPCHRVIGENGSLVGYGGKLWRKKHLLDLEKNASLKEELTSSQIKIQKNKEGLIYLPYEKETFDSSATFNFMKKRLMQGIEIIKEDVYYRTFRIDEEEGYFSIRDNKNEARLELKIVSTNEKATLPIYKQVRKMFDMDTNFEDIGIKLKASLLIKNNHEIPRLPMAFNLYEFVIRAVLGQQVTVSAATTLASRVVKKANLKFKSNIEGLDYFFPNLEELSNLDLSGLGITNTRINTIKDINKALKEKKLSLEYEQELDKFVSDFTKIKGIGNWTANYIAMRGLGIRDAFPATDLGIIKKLSPKNRKLSEKEILKKAEKWKPFRAYATLCLWAKEQ